MNRKTKYLNEHRISLHDQVQSDEPIALIVTSLLIPKNTQVCDSRITVSHNHSSNTAPRTETHLLVLELNQIGLVLDNLVRLVPRLLEQVSKRVLWGRF